ncbi:MAG: class I SAM-dependent methyltransferase [Actinomycetes bacterium]
MNAETLRALARAHPDRLGLWIAFLNETSARSVAEIGVYRGVFAAEVLDGCPNIEAYYMVDPWQHLDEWNKPANATDEKFDLIYQQAMDRTQEHVHKRIVLRGRTVDVLDQVPDGELDFAYVDGDHTLRGITVDLVRAYPKIRHGGFLGGDDFARSIWHHGERFEPTLVFPFAVYFAEAVGTRIYALPQRQFLIEKSDENRFEFVDLTGRYEQIDLLSQMQGWRNGPSAAGSRGSPRTAVSRRIRKLLR